MQHLGDRGRRPEPGQRRAEAEVDALAEGEVPLPRTVDVQDVGALELTGVAVRRALERQDRR